MINKEGPGETQGERARRLASEDGLDWEGLERDRRDDYIEQACPAGGLKEKDYHNDGSRYWEKTSQTSRGSGKGGKC